MLQKRLAILIGAWILVAMFASAASASDRLYWGNNNVTSLSFAGLDGSGGGDLLNSAVGPAGLAIDSSAARLYFTNEGANTISFVDLKTGIVGPLNTGTATVQAPDGLAIDDATRKIYWANDSIPGTISFANLDGSGGADLNTGVATLNGPSGVAIDKASGRLYWANYNTPSISFANLDNSGGGGDLPTGTATLAGPSGVAIDSVSGRIFWADYGAGNKISFARLDGSGGADLSTPGATVQGPWGVAIDSAAGRVYWANNSGNSLAFAKLDGSGGGPLATGAATVDGPAFPILQEIPVAAGPPAITGGSAVKSTLTCSQGTWGADLFGASLYRAPQGFAFQWSRDGKAIAGATASTVNATSPGEYSCVVTATNLAGSTAQTSAAHRVGPPQPPDFNTALFDGTSLFVRLKCPARFKPACVGKAAGLAVKEKCTRSHGRRQCKPAEPITSSVSAAQKPTKWKVVGLLVKKKFKATVAAMAKNSNKKLLYVRELIHAKQFDHGRTQAVFHIYKVRKVAAP